jgi:hypothetical protein
LGESPMTVLEKSKFIDLTGPFPANPAQCAGRRQHARWRTGIKFPFRQMKNN